MKKWMILLLILLLTGCGAPAPDVEEPVEEEPPAVEMPVEMPEEPVEEIIRYEADTTLFADTLYAEDGTQLLHYSMRVPFLSVWREDGTQVTQAETEKEKTALAAAEDFNRQFADWYSEETIQEAVRNASEDLAWRQEEGIDWYSGYQLELNCDIYQTERLISISGQYVAFTGGAHPNTYLLSWNFDPVSGSFFGPEALAEQEGLREAVTAELVRQTEAKAAEFGEPADVIFWSDYKEILAEWPGYAVSFDETGMTVAFSPYELAAYALGAQEFRIPYDLLMPYLDDAALETLGMAAK